MVQPLLPLPPQPFTKETYNSPPYTFPVPDDTLQLQIDATNVLEGRVEMSTFSSERQEQIKNYYRFSATRQNSKSHNRAAVTGDTLDII